MINYLYIDDDAVQKSKDKVSGFVTPELEINATQHQGDWESQLEYIRASIMNIDGLLLDLGLNDLPNEQQKRANFRGTALAQEIRTRQKEGLLKNIPIILFSAHDKLESLLESTGSDLFDMCIDKETVNPDVFDDYSRQFIALANGYVSVESKDIKNILGNYPDDIDTRFFSQLESLANHPPHVTVGFILNELIKSEGILIDESTLAARLGIDISKSTEWDIVKSKLTTCLYTGILCEGWPRWWMSKVKTWWNEHISEEPLRTIGAHQRVALLKEKLGIENLVAATRIDKAQSEDFWTICQGHKRPLDTIDGLIIIGQDNLYPWQEPKYVSIDAALKRTHLDDWKGVATSEIMYLDKLKQKYSKHRE